MTSLNKLNLSAPSSDDLQCTRNTHTHTHTHTHQHMFLNLSPFTYIEFYSKIDIWHLNDMIWIKNKPRPSFYFTVFVKQLLVFFVCWFVFLKLTVDSISDCPAFSPLKALYPWFLLLISQMKQEFCFFFGLFKKNFIDVLFYFFWSKAAAYLQCQYSRLRGEKKNITQPNIQGRTWCAVRMHCCCNTFTYLHAYKCTSGHMGTCVT